MKRVFKVANQENENPRDDPADENSDQLFDNHDQHVGMTSELGEHNENDGARLNLSEEHNKGDESEHDEDYQPIGEDDDAALED